jgi:hypothetical protein
MFDHRIAPRVSIVHPIQISFGIQIVLQGQIKDISLKSAFILIKSSIHMTLNDKLSFQLENLPNQIEGSIKGNARISRIVPGEGIAVYFVDMDEASTQRLQRLINANLKNIVKDSV